jgi:hypothetical protein
MTTGRIRNHWWWRPGWSVGTRWYTFHFTWADNADVQAHAAAARERLAAINGLDLIPGRWLHCTAEGVGNARKVSGPDLDAIVTGARRRVAALAPVPVTLSAPEAAPEGVACWIDTMLLDPVRDQLRAAIGDVWGPDKVPEDQAWKAHVSVAYANTDMDAAPVDAVLAGMSPVHTVVRAVDLIELGRDKRLYEWQTVAALPLSG